MRYSVSYDLDKPGQDYPRIHRELERLGGKRILMSYWVINRTNTSAIRLRDHLKRSIDRNDRLMVIELEGTDWASYNLMTDPNNV